MAIQMRRGLKADFDPAKMLPGEWAVSIDSDTNNQIVWMCFAAGVCKRMGTYEDFKAQIAEATADIRAQYIDDFNVILDDVEAVQKAVEADASEVAVAKSDIVDTYLPNIKAYAKAAETAATEAETSALAAANSELSAANSKQSAAASASTAVQKATEASTSAESASASANTALTSKTAAETARTAAESASDIAAEKAREATEAEASATASASSATNSAATASASATTAEANAQTAVDKAILAQSYAVGGTGTREGEDTDNAMYYMKQAKAQTGGIPTKLSELENDTGFITAAVDNLVNYYKSSQLYTKTEIDSKLSAIPKFDIVTVSELPTADISETTIYLLKEQEEGTDKCSEWIYTNGSWERLGYIDVDLSEYLKKDGNGSNLTEAFLQASELANIVTGEKHATIFGKIAKAIATLISHISTAATASVLGHVKVDNALDSASENPVQNKALYSAFAGKLATTGDASNTTAAFTEATVLAELSSGEKHSVSMGKLKLAVKNLITLIQLIGSTDISAIGDGTVTGGLDDINGKLADVYPFRKFEASLKTSLLDYALDAGIGVHFLALSGSNYVGGDVPGIYVFGTVMILKRGSDSIEVLIFPASNNIPIRNCRKSSTEWSDWYDFAGNKIN